VIRNNLKAEAKEKCKPYFKAFGDCAVKEGLFVAFNCRTQNAECELVDHNISFT
jgi:hypothetical protein